MSVASQTSATGVVMSTYVPAGEIPPGSFTQAEPSAKEFERRAKLAREVVKDIGYTAGEMGFDGNTCGVLVAVDHWPSPNQPR